ncbi:MAG: DUF1499 domain-containing protein [Verrucomicrobiota bacterium]|nr:DUF1499 domain-containing protein [Verrucomicrobiota bacterium]
MFEPCPASPNCVSTEAQDKRHALPPFRFEVEHAPAWAEIRAAVLSFPRTTLRTERENYLQVECRSRTLGFVDDLEVELRPSEGVVRVRSAARSGYYDFGVNRRRVEQLRKLLRARDLIY